jgi:hypothetical protein
MACSQGHFRHISHSRMTQPHSCGRGVILFNDAETAVSHSALLGLLSQQPKHWIRWPEADPSCFVTCMSLRLATFATSTAWDVVETKAANKI